MYLIKPTDTLLKIPQKYTKKVPNSYISLGLEGIYLNSNTNIILYTYGTYTHRIIVIIIRNIKIDIKY